MDMSPLTFGVCVTLLPWLHAQPLRVRQQVQPVCSWAPGTESCLGQIPVPQELPHRVRPLLGDHLPGPRPISLRDRQEPGRAHQIICSGIWNMAGTSLWGSRVSLCRLPWSFHNPCPSEVPLCRTVGYILAPFQWVVKHDHPQPFAGFTSDRMCCY